MEQSDNNILDGILMAEEDSGQHELDSGRLSRQPSVDVLAGTRSETLPTVLLTIVEKCISIRAQAGARV